MDSSEQIEERAAEWLAKRDGDGWTVADEEAFQRWLNASTANRVAFLRLDTVWQQANRLKALSAGLRPGTVPPPREWRQSPFFRDRASALAEPAQISATLPAEELQDPPTRREGSPLSADSSTGLLTSRIGDPFRPSARRERSAFAHPIRALAASMLIATAVGLGWYLSPTGPSYRTAVGGVTAVPMADGSRITLNTDSEIRVAVSNLERRVELAQGEAFFDVAEDAYRPFVVEAGNKRFIAVGTKFSVLRKGTTDRLVVTEGRVRIEGTPSILSKISQLPSAATGGAPGAKIPSIEVSAGGVARSGEAGVLVEMKALAEAEAMLSWRRGYLVFNDTTLADAVAEFNRYNTSKLVIEDASVAGIRIGGNFRSTNVDAFVRLLEEGLPIRVERRGERIVLSQN